MEKKNIRVAELFAGVGGFRIGLERAGGYEVVWSNQWEPSTKKQDASLIYTGVFGSEGHSNVSIEDVDVNDIPDFDLLVGGFPCQDYSVAATLDKSGGIEGKKGVLWWQICRILKEKGERRPKYLFLENVDRLLVSPAKQRGRDFAIILKSLESLGYAVEWRVINAADYGMPQRRRRTYIIGYPAGNHRMMDHVLRDGPVARAFRASVKPNTRWVFEIKGDVAEVSATFGAGGDYRFFRGASMMSGGLVYTTDLYPEYYSRQRAVLGDVLIDEKDVPEEYFIAEEDLPKWKYAKGAKKFDRVSRDGFYYTYSEGGMPFPDSTDKPSRTIITGEGGKSPSRFKHVVETPSGRYRRLVPIELERLNMFPDNHTLHPGVSESRRVFLMGNALVCGVVERIGKTLREYIDEHDPASHR